MLWVGIQPDVYTFPCVLRTCGGVPELARRREVNVHVVRFGFESDVDVVNTLITMYVLSARLMFDRMPRRDNVSFIGYILVDKNTVISRHCLNRDTVIQKILQNIFSNI